MGSPESSWMQMDDDPEGIIVPLVSKLELENLNTERAKQGLAPLSIREAEAQVVNNLGLEGLEMKLSADDESHIVRGEN